ncbi:GNAT family N-acetyltransferase [Vibrio sp. MEBiC08052]|uniref:GNAT family N-acetyltransferase n=1 Tax=Vibrio sp. MEBiC08052 TaxID=1761910 RepID=UPI0007407B08|nr:GNAT family N-acetyltransferase [Vibrio sp. MEBiC08052]KUI97341.1 histone acetyltransferase HPA2/related acetyltransferase [Vibrio sp. MEBiC08052]
MQGYYISSDKKDLNFDVIYSYLSTSYWAEGIPESILRKAIENTLCFGVYLDSGEQVGFARVITDQATFAYLADVFILEAHRGKGLSKWLMATILEAPDLQGLRRILLTTKDAHGLYAQYGFVQVEHPERLMHIWHPNIYSTT